MKLGLYVGAVICVFIGVNLYGNRIDAAERQSAYKYKTCVIREYHMTPVAWYEQHGAYPACQ
jgi:hypothetical protein